MPYTSYRATVEAQLRRAQDAGLVAASVMLQNRMKVALRKGYTSGDFITGRSVNAVARTLPHDVPGARQVEVGTSLLYNLFWEIGHVNRWTRKYERVEKWRPTLLDSRSDLQREFSRVFALVMQRSAPPAAASEAAD
jgi:hypothetical protein